MSPKTIQIGSQSVDFTDRVARSTTVVASPAAAAETIICTVTAPADLRADAVVLLFGWAAYTVGTNGVSVNLKLRQTDASGTTKAATGAVTAVAANLGSMSVLGVDAAPGVTGQVYVLTMTVASGSAASTVSGVELLAIV